jgi:hypothetical protein
MIVPSPRRSASLRAFTPVFDGLWTRVDALNRGEGAMVVPREEAGEGDIPCTEFSRLPLTPTLSPAGCGLARFRQILK